MIKRLMTKYVPGMLTCEETDSYLFDFQEGLLSNNEKLKVRLHLSMCTECHTYFHRYRNTIRISQACFNEAPIVKNVPEELIQIMLKSRIEK